MSSTATGDREPIPFDRLELVRRMIIYSMRGKFVPAAEEKGMMGKKINATPALGTLHRNPLNVFEAWDDFGNPVLPLTCEDDDQSDGAPAEDIELKNRLRSVPSLAGELNWRT